YGIGREETDAYALQSQERYAKAKEEGFFDDEILPVRSCKLEQHGLKPRKVKLPRKVEELNHDEHPRKTAMAKLAKLPAVFRENGAQSAGNSSGIVDGACAVIVASEKAAQRLGVTPIGRLLASASAGVPPEIMGIGPAPAIQSILKNTDNTIDAIDNIEVNEAFGAQCIAVMKEAQLDPAKVNVNGGSIAMGHPLAATGTRLTLTQLRQLKRSGGKLGIVGACIGGGQGTVLLLENWK
ncbi:MAG: thiolase family protein, partial [bacterium]|nr:thiolase family protein [bacterium]